MNEVQENLLKLVKEIDEICLKHDIEYYVFAGSMLGVERNKGFLPWDDDMDVVMTRKNYEKFKRVIEKEKPANRVFDDKESCKHYPLHFGKYTSTDTSSIIRSLAFGDCAAGFWIDIMYVSPMPREERKRKRVMKLFPVLCELENEFYTEYPYRYKGFQSLYRFFLFLSRILGKKRVVNYLKKQCDNFSDEECDDYFLYHSLDADFRIYTKPCFEKPVRRKYENVELNVSPNNRRMCREGYGDGWMMVPPVVEQAVHSTITDCNVPYTVYKKDYMQFIDADKVMKDFKSVKEAHIEKVHKERIALDSFYRMEAKLISMETEKAIQKSKISMDELLQEKKYKEIGGFFKKYIAMQWSARIKNNGIFVPLREDYLRGLLLYLICEKQEFYSAARLVSLCKKDGATVPDYLDEIEYLIQIHKELSVALWDQEDFEYVIAMCDKHKELVSKYELKDFRHAYCIAMLKTKPNESEQIERICRDLISNEDTSGVPDKILGDLYYEKNREEAMIHYANAKTKLRNGLLLIEINDKIEGMENE